MSDRTDSTPDPNPYLRQSFAWRLERPADLAALSRVVEMIEEWAMETGQFGPDNHQDSLVAAFEAAGHDALYLSRFLSELARERFSSAMTEEQTRLCELAESWAASAQALGEAIRGEAARRMES